MDGSNSSSGGISSRGLPSLFSISNGSSMASKDLEGLIAMNDSALSQQIEFILQDAPMEQDADEVATATASTSTQIQHHQQRHHHQIIYQQQSVDSKHELQQLIADTEHSNSQGAISNTPLASVIKLENPPNSTTPITSASDLSQTSQDVETNHPTHTQTLRQHHFLNGRGIIVRSSNVAHINSIAAITQQQQRQHHHSQSHEEEDPELNDENLQDIEEEANAVDDEDHTAHLVETTETQTSRLTYTNAEGQTTQLVLPSGSIVSTSTRAVTVPVSEALAQLQRRPVFISNGVANVAGTTLVRMPAVLSRNGSMAVLNVVQQQVGSSGQTQLILQAAPVANGTNSTPMLVTTAPPSTINQTLQTTSSSTAATTAATQTSHILTNALTSSSSIITLNTSAAAQSGIVTDRQTTVTTTSSPSPSQNGGMLNNHPVASTSAQAQQATYASASSPSPSSASNSPASVSQSPPGTIYQCVECVEKFDNKELYEIHRSGHANNMKCAICNMVLKSLKNYEKHCLRCKPYECQICGRVVRFRPNFIKHMRVHTGQQSERHKYKCEVCHKEFMSFEYFKVHKKIHNENVNLTCEICGKQFSALASLRGHSKLHSGVKLHKCEVCGKGFGQRYNLKIHARTHTGDFPFECKICKKKLHTQSSLQTHMQVHQRVQNTTQGNNSSSTKSSASSASNNNNNNNINSTNTTATSGNLSSSGSAGSAHNSPTSTIIKIEPSSSITLERPTTSAAGVGGNILLSQHSSMHDDLDENSGLSDGLNSLNGHHYVSTSSLKNATGEDSSESSNTSQEQLRQTRQILLSRGTPTRAIVINNYSQSDRGVDTLLSQTSQPQQHHAQVIRQNGSGSSTSSALQQQLMRKTPIIHSTGGVTSLGGSVFAVQHGGVSPSPSPSSSSTSCSSSVVVSKSGVPISLGSSTIIRSTRDHDANLNGHHTRQQRSTNHRNHHRRRHLADMDDDDDDTNLNHPSASNGLHHHHHHHQQQRRRHFADDDDDVMLDEKSSPSLATTAIKTEPNFYTTGDNSNEMLIKEEVNFDDNSDHSPHSPPSSKFGMSNFDNDVDLSHSLPTYGYLLDQHSIPDTMPAQLYADDDDFRLDHNSLGGLHQNSSSTTDGDFIKKEWTYGTSSNYTINGKFDDDSNALCDAANFIYN